MLSSSVWVQLNDQGVTDTTKVASTVIEGEHAVFRLSTTPDCANVCIVLSLIYRHNRRSKSIIRCGVLLLQ